MYPLQMDLVWRRNAPEPETFFLKEEDGTPVDLTGISMRLQARLYPGAPGAALVTLGIAASGAPGISIDDAPGGAFTITPPGSATLLALPRRADNCDPPMILAYDLIIIHPDGAAEPFTEGRLILPNGVTI